MNETKYLTTGSLAVVKVRNHKLLRYGTSVLIKKMHGNTITVVPLVDEKAYFVDANILHNNLMPYF
jgi:hypothetical protein